MPPLAIADAGPLVAFLDRRDAHHAWTREQFWKLRPPLLVCEQVLVEALFLLRQFPAAQDAHLGQVEGGTLRIAFALAAEVAAVRQLVAKYADVPMSLADACLVRMSELYEDHEILTLDSDVRIDRKHGREIIPLVTTAR